MGNIWIILLTTGILHVGTTYGQFRFKSCTNSSYLAPFPGNCFKFLACTSTGYVAMNCPSNLVFNVHEQYCDYRSNVPSCRDVRGPSDGCNPNRCANGTCIVVTNNQGYRCQCDMGFTGVDCSTDIDECKATPCVRGTCVNTIGNFSCDCGNSGYTGRFCQIPPTVPCIDNQPCQQGSCEIGPNNNFCICNTGYTGRFCETKLDVCEPSPCQNNGLCTVGQNSYTCDCSGTGFTGRNCTVPEGISCQPNPCIRGTCSNNPAGGFSCDCTGTGYQGALCNETRSVDCTMNGINRCENGGTCVQLVNEFVCRCPPGFTGGACERLVNPSRCPAHPCPADVPRFNYPAWNDTTCRSYYNCEFGVLSLRTCSTEQRFDTITMVCVPATDTLAVFCNEFQA